MVKKSCLSVRMFQSKYQTMYFDGILCWDNAAKDFGRI